MAKAFPWILLDKEKTKASDGPVFSNGNWAQKTTIQLQTNN